MKKWKRSDITDVMVVQAYRTARDSNWAEGWPYEVLARQTGVPEKVAYAACERAEAHGLIECGVSLRSGWLTDAGRALLP